MRVWEYRPVPGLPGLVKLYIHGRDTGRVYGPAIIEIREEKTDGVA